MMHNINFTVSNGKIVLTDYPEHYDVRAVSEQNYRELNSYVLHKYDLAMAKDAMERWGNDTQLNEILLTAALVRFIKCFSKSKDRIQLDYSIVFPGSDGRRAFEYYKDLRNRFVAHDESDYLQVLLGIIIDVKEKRVIESINMSLSVNIGDEQYQQGLSALINHALNYVNEKIEEESEHMVSDYKEKDWTEIEKMQPIQYQVPAHINRKKM